MSYELITIRIEADKVGIVTLNRPKQLNALNDALMDELELLTAHNDLIHLTIAINYGGRDEVTRAAKRMAFEVQAGRLQPEDVDAETLARFLDTHVLPDPDLVIRTSGEARISNFLLWQSAYSEYEFVDTLWPDFTAEEFGRIVGNYATRDRRFGAVKA